MDFGAIEFFFITATPTRLAHAAVGINALGCQMASKIGIHLHLGKLVAGVGFEPTMLGYEPSALDQARRLRFDRP